eukprot:747982-Hanusia_phi.AAC.4
MSMCNLDHAGLNRSLRYPATLLVASASSVAGRYEAASSGRVYEPVYLKVSQEEPWKMEIEHGDRQQRPRVR